MTPQSELAWANSLLKQFSLQIRAGATVDRLELQNDLTRLFASESKNGMFYKDDRDLLNQAICEKEVEDPLLDDETEAKRAKKQLDAARRTWGLI